MKPKHVKRIRKTGTEKQRNDSSGTNIQKYTQSQSPEPPNKDRQKTSFYAAINSETKTKPEDAFHTLNDHQQADKKNKETSGPSTHAVAETVPEKFGVKKAQGTEKFSNAANKDKLPLSYHVDNSHSVVVRNPCTNKKTRDVETSRHKSSIVDASKRFEAHEVDIRVSEDSPDQTRENTDTNLLPQQRGQDRRQEIPDYKLPRTSATADLVNNIYRTLVRMKVNHIPLAELTDIKVKHARIHADFDSSNDILTLLEENEDKFDIVYRADEPLISVKTEIAICPVFTNDTDIRHECNDLHVCKYFLLSKCTRKECKFGHNLSSKHNKAVFREYTLDGIDKDRKMSLIRSVESRNASTMPLICKFYNNEGGCKNGNKCSHLHICKNFINGDCKFGKKCRRCHSILNKQHMSVLQRYGLIPDSHNYKEIVNLLKDTLEHGEVVLKRDIRPKRDDGTGSRQCYRKERHKSKRSQTSSDESETSAYNNCYSGYEDDSTDSELSSLEVDFAHAQYDSPSESTDEDYRSHTPYRALGNGFAFGEDVKGAMGIDFKQPKTTRNNSKPIMMFESQIENKQFRVRAKNGSWKIADESGTWLCMDEDETDRLWKLHNDFIRFAEQLISNS